MSERIRPSVVDLIADRVHSGSTPGKREDPYKVGLLIEGGGMRGVISGGMITAFQAMGGLEAVDSIYANSSGSCAAMYLVAGQTPDGTSIYYEDINNKEFIDVGRVLHGKPIMDVQYLTHSVMKHKKPLETGRIVDSGVTVHTYVVSARDLDTLDVTEYKNADAVHDTLHYTTRIPVVAGMPIKVEDTYLADGGTLMGTVPLDATIADGCTHILAFLTREDGTMRKKITPVERLIPFFLKQEFPELASKFWDGYKEYERAMQKISTLQKSENSLVEVEVVAPPKLSTRVHTLEMRRDVLIRGAKVGYHEVEKKFANSGVIFDRSVRVRE